jgi:RecJ-like exonuclease
MIRSSAVILIAMLMCISCTRMEHRGARYNATACPICSNITDGACSYCKGTKKCMYCNGTGERRVVSPNYSEEEIKPFDYKEPCPYCNGTGVCTYCGGTGKCWACGGTAKVAGDWECLRDRTTVAEKVKKKQESE